MTRTRIPGCAVLALALGACAHGAGAGGPGPAAIASGTLIDSTGQRVGVAAVVDTAGAVRLAISEADGSADTSLALPADLVGTGPRSLIRPGGAALVIHAHADDDRSDPGGSAGARVACTVLEPG